MRRYEREMTDKAEIETVLAKATVVHLAMVDEGRPYLVPMNFGYADGEQILASGELAYAHQPFQTCPADGDPVIRVIHRYPVLHPLGYRVERRCGQGGLIVSALDLRPELVEARHLLAQLCRHAASPAFHPEQELSSATTARLLTVGQP